MQLESCTITNSELSPDSMKAYLELPGDCGLVHHQVFVLSKAFILDIFNPPQWWISFRSEAQFVVSLLFDLQSLVQISGGIKDIQ